MSFYLSNKFQAFKDRFGFIDYNHSGSGFALSANTWTDLPNNGSGSFSRRNYKPTELTELLDTSTGYLDFSQLELGDSVIIRNDYTVIPDNNNATLEFRYLLGTGLGQYDLATNFGILSKGGGALHRFSLKTDLIYLGDDNTRNNPVKLQVRLSSTGTAYNSGSVLQIIPNI